MHIDYSVETVLISVTFTLTFAKDERNPDCLSWLWKCKIMQICSDVDIAKYMQYTCDQATLGHNQDFEYNIHILPDSTDYLSS